MAKQPDGETRRARAAASSRASSEGRTRAASRATEPTRAASRAAEPTRSASPAARATRAAPRSKDAATRKATASTPAPRAKANSAAARQVVIVVHGMGEQRPMDTIRHFAETAWADNPAIMRPHDRPSASPSPDNSAAQTAIENPSGTTTLAAAEDASASPRETMWNRPDPRLGSLELRKITTRASLPSAAFPKGVHTDFVELYWADLTEGATMRGVFSWFRMMLWRRPSRAPSSVIWHYLILWALLLASVGVIGTALLYRAGWVSLDPAYATIIDRVSAAVIVLSGGLLLLGRYAENFLISRIGRVARYTMAKPENIGARAATRERGLQLLRALHADPSVDRIILVGHSLGAILAYDLIGYYWAELDAPRALDPLAKEGPAKEKFTAYQALEATRLALGDAAKDGAEIAPDYPALTAWREAQARFRRTLAQGVASEDAAGKPTRKERWLISDFLTIGSPLAHAEFLLARDRDDLVARQAGRELPTNPPKAEPLDKDDARAAARLGIPPQSMSYWSDRRRGPQGWRLHHATPFAAVRWTNLHDRPRRLMLWGDFASGPAGRKEERGAVVDLFGAGVRDLWLKSGESAWATFRAGLFTHTYYWRRQSPKTRLEMFRRALDLLDQDEV